MIKSWKKFNESKNRDLAIDEVKEKFQEVRDILIEFEDEGMINDYSLVLKGEESGRGGFTFNPKTGDLERWFGNVIGQIENRIFYLGLEKNSLCIIANLRLPIIKHTIDNGQGLMFGGIQGRSTLISPMIDSEGIKKFEDILVINSRLTSTGYTVYYDLSASHTDYKPLKMLIYFTI